ncbi:MAG TPA: MYXO-CTERM sorting domain-containing protein [Polyangiaceae bacterium]|nr:MYXO-CTERM sorting domain-containing protein [Polyangiaceae bacterium]
MPNRGLLGVSAIALCATLLQGRSVVPSASPAVFAASGDGFVARAGRLDVRVDAPGTTIARDGDPHRSVVLRTARVGDALVGPAAPVLRADGAVERPAGAAWERVEPRSGGVEQSWRFDARSRGDGDLVVRVEAGVAAFAGTTDRGVHLRDGAGPGGLLYGEATWVDARGGSTPLSPAWRDGAIELRVPAQVVARSTYPAVLDPLVSVEIAVDKPVPAPAGGATKPSIAASQSGYLAVWVDTIGTDSQLLAARLDVKGAMLDATPISVYTFDTTVTGAPAVASDGTDYFVAWRRSSTLDLVGTRVRASDGALLDESPDPVVLANPCVSTPAAAFVGNTYVVAFLAQQPSGTAYDVRTQRVRGAAPVDPLAGVTLGTATPTVLDPLPSLCVAAGPDQAFVTWAALAAREQVSSGAVLDAPPIAFAQLAKGHFPRAAYDGANYYVTWPDTTGTLWGARVRASDGALLDPDDMVNMVPGSKKLRTATGAQQEMLRIAPTDGLLGVVYALGSSGGAPATLASFAVDPATGMPTGSGPDPSFVTNVGSAFDLAVGAPGAEVSFAYSDATSTPAGTAGLNLAHAKGVFAAGAGASTVRLSQVTQHTLTPIVASNGTDYLVVWWDATANAVYASRVSAATRTSLDPQGILLQAGVGLINGWSLASNGSGYLYVWSTGASVLARPIAADGTAGATITVRTSPSNSTTDWPFFPGLIYDGQNYFVDWWEGQNLEAARVGGSNLAVIDSTPILLASEAVGNGRSAVSMAVDKPTDPMRTLLAVWDQSVNVAGAGTESQTTAVRVRPATGAVLDANSPLALRLAPGAGPGALATDGTYFVLFWTQFVGDSSTDWSLYGSRLDPQTAAVLDKTGSQDGLLLIDSPTVDLGSLVWDGRSYVALWAVAPPPGATRLDLAAARFTSGLTLLDPPPSAGGFPLHPQAENDGMGMATTGGGHSFAVYPVPVTAIGQLGQHIHGRFIDDDGLRSDGGAVYQMDDASAEAGAGLGDGAAAGGDASTDGPGGGDAAARSDAGIATGGGDGGDAGPASDAGPGDGEADAMDAAGDAALFDAEGQTPFAAPTGANAGCGCRASGTGRTPGGFAAALSLAVFIGMRRRRGGRFTGA